VLHQVPHSFTTSKRVDDHTWSASAEINAPSSKAPTWGPGWHSSNIWIGAAIRKVSYFCRVRVDALVDSQPNSL
jgi:hypothetical protein